MTEGKDELAPETEALLRVAIKIRQENEERLEALKTEIETMETDPAIYAALWEMAAKEDRLRKLQEETSDWINPESGPGGPVEAVLNRNEEYERKVAGTHYGDNALSALESYAMRACEIGKSSRAVEVEVPLKEAEEVVARFSEIKKEAIRRSPDVKKIDTLLAEFLSRRLQHFAATLDQRVKAQAAWLHQYYQEHPDVAGKYNVVNRTVEEWVDDLQRSGAMVKVRALLPEVEKIMKQDGYKAKDLAKLGDDIGRCTSILGGTRSFLY